MSVLHRHAGPIAIRFIERPPVRRMPGLGLPGSEETDDVRFPAGLPLERSDKGFVVVGSSDKNRNRPKRLSSVCHAVTNYL